MSEVTTTAAAPAAPARQALPLSLKSLLDAGVHFGHQTKRWNPKMRPYIYGARGGVHIVDLDKTARLFARAFRFVEETSARGGNILFVGTKRQAADIIQEEAARCGASFVVNRWLGGTLTNFRTIKQGLERLATLERMKEDGTYEQFRKKEVSRMEKERERLEKYLGGLKGMNGLPAAIFVIDPAMESIAVDEANKLGIPVVAITDTNCNPDLIQYVIPGNDDAIRSIKLITSRLADAVLQGAQQRKDVPRDDVPVRGGAGGEGFGRGHRGERGDRGDRGPRGPREVSN